MSKIKKMFGNEKLFLPILIFIFTLIIYFITSPGETPYDHFIRLSRSFLNGKYYITENPTWLSELIPASNGTFYIAYPPMPAIILSPIILIFGSLFEQQYLAHILGALTVFFTYKISLKIKNDIKIAVWSTVLVSFGTIIWYLSSVGSSWYLAQVSSFFFLMAALNESLAKKRPFLVGLLLGASYLSRLTTILSFPLFLYLVKGKKKKNIIIFFLGILPFLAFNFGYNYLRFGTIFDKGYILIPGVLNEIWYQKGLFNLSYIPRHLRVIFASFPIIQNKFPYIIPSWMGLSIWITTPAFIYSLFSNIKEKIVKLSWIIITLISLVIFSHGTTGFTQFGYRFAVDFYPFLIFLTIKGASKNTLKWHHLVLLIISVIVNLWGVIFINKFNWVRY